LSEWLMRHDSFEVSETERNEATQAILHIGTNSLPFLLKWISYEPSALQHRIQVLFAKLPVPLDGSVRLRSLILGQKSTWRSGTALSGFAVLGTNGLPALNQLTSLANDTNFRSGSLKATRALGYLGTNSLPPLNAMLFSRHPIAHGFVIAVIDGMELDTNAIPLLPGLVECTTEPDNRFAAEVALRNMTNRSTSSSPGVEAGRIHP
jgi:hypothetical protein